MVAKALSPWQGPRERHGRLRRSAGGATPTHRQPQRLLPQSKRSYAGDYTCRYRELCAHLGVIASRNNRGVAHENGAIEGPHRHWKRRLEQQLLQHGSRHFETEVEYRQQVAQVSDRFSGRDSVQQKLLSEQLHLRPLQVERVADYEPVVATVRKTSTNVLRSVT